MSTATAAAHTRPEAWWAYPPLAGLLVYVVGQALPDLPWWPFAASGVVLAGLGWAVADRVWWRGDYGPLVAGVARWGVALSCLAAGGWLAVSAELGPLQVWQWLALGTAVVACWWWLLVWIAPGVARRRDDADTVAAGGLVPTGPVSELVALYSGILTRSGSDDVRVLDVTVSPSGGVETARITPAPAAKSKAITRTAFEGRLPSIVVEAARTLTARGIDLQDQDVNVEPGTNAAEFLLHVTVQRAIDRVIPYVLDREPQPWCGPKRIGFYEDDRPLDLTICHEKDGASHTEVVGATGSGKSVLLNNVIGRQTGSDQGEVWLIGTSKLTKLAWDWLWPWLCGRTDRPVLDRVAGESPAACLRALADALQYAVECNRATAGGSARKPSRGRGALLVIIDEASDLLERNDLRITLWDGRKMNASELVAAIQKGGRTGPVGIVKANQDGLFGSLGSEGNKQRRNSTIGIALKVKRAGDATSVLPGMPSVNAAKLPKTMMYVEPNDDEPRLMRARAADLEDDLVHEVAEVNTAWRYGLDPAIASRLMYYADRWDPRWHQELIDQLHGRGLSWPGAPGHQQVLPTVPKPGPVPGLPDREETTVTIEQPADSTDDGPVPVPDGWGDEAFDVWAAFDAVDGISTDAGAPSAAPGPFGNTDTSTIDGALSKVAAFVRGTSGPAVPDPLGAVVAALAAPQAPQEWVSAAQLAVVLGRVKPDAGETAVAGAAQQLGRELRAQAPELEPVQRTVGERRPRGYLVADLRAAAAALGGK